jgi:hypothetical protein
MKAKLAITGSSSFQPGVSYRLDQLRTLSLALLTCWHTV